MKRLIINADVFGSHVLVNRAVAEAVEHGALRSTTLMAGGDAVDDAIRTAHEHSALGIGIHLTLVRGRPVLPPDEIPTLVKADGMLEDDYGTFMKKYLRCAISLDDVRRELAAQIRKAQSAITLTHFDSHQHMHVLPGILGTVLHLARDAHLTAMRVPSAPVLLGSTTHSLGQLIGRTGLLMLAEVARFRATRRNIKTPEHFRGIVAGEAVSDDYMLYVAENLDGGTTEVMVHPGTDNGVLQKASDWDHDFEKELRAITSPRVLATIKARGIELANFGAL